MRKPVAIGIAVAFTLAGCSGGDPGLNIGMRQTALDLEFKVAKLAKPVPRQVVVEYLPAPPVPAPLPPKVIVLPPLPEPPLPPNPCPVAPYDGVPDLNVALRPDSAPLPGTYSQRMSGVAKVTVGATSLTAALPPTATVSVGKATIVTPPPLDVANQITANPTSPGSQTGPSKPGPQFDVVTRVTGKYVVTERFFITDTQVELVQRTVRDGGRVTTFTPTPALTFYKYGGEGTTWNSAGVDLETGVAMVVQGTTGARQRVDVCGKLVDTYRVTLSSTLVDVRTGTQVTTSTSDPSTFNIATQYGGIFVRRHVNETLTGKDDKTGEDLTKTLTYTTTATTVGPTLAARG